MEKNTGNLSDQQLVSRALRGDTNAFAAIVKNSEGLVAQIIFKMIHNSPDRKDILQEVYLKVYKNLSGFKFQSKLTTWIGSIAYRICLDHLTKKQLVLAGDLFGDDYEGLAGAGDLAYNLREPELAGILRTEIRKLPPIYQTLVTLFHQEEMSYEEIGEITGLPGGTVKNYLFRARKELKRSLLKNYKREDL